MIGYAVIVEQADDGGYGAWSPGKFGTGSTTGQRPENSWSSYLRDPGSVGIARLC